MLTANTSIQPEVGAGRRPFSLALYLGIIVALSWPFEIAFAVWAQTPFMRYALSSLAMIMVGVGTLLASRYIFHDGIRQAGWRWGRPQDYGLVLGLVVAIWIVPTALELMLGLNRLPAQPWIGSLLALFMVRFGATLLPALGEELGWRGYLLRHLAQRYPLRRALLLHAVIWWAWHIPALVGMGLETAGNGGRVGAIAFMLLISLVPAMMHAVVYAFIWSTTRSLAVATTYHAAFDEVRDSLEASVGFGPLVDLWQMLVLTVVGAALLWKGSWRGLAAATARSGERRNAEGDPREAGDGQYPRSTRSFPDGDHARS